MLRLASASPRRIQLLRLLQVPFESSTPNVDEQQFESPARAKATAVARYAEVTIAADTEVALDGERMGKPKDDAHAVAMLATLSGREQRSTTVRRPVARQASRAVPSSDRTLCGHR